MTRQELAERWKAKQRSLAGEVSGTRLLASKPMPLGTTVREFIDESPGEHVPPRRTQSPLEEQFAHFASKVLHRHCALQAQFHVRTRLGVYRLDFRIAGPNGVPAIGIECDGAKFHDWLRDAWRDAAILGEAAVKDIVRIEGKDLYRRPYDVLFLVAQLYPTCFSARGLNLLAQLASREVREFDGSMPGFVYFSGEIELDDESMLDAEVSEEQGGFTDFLHLAVSGRSRHASTEWRFRHSSILAEPGVSLSEWVRREERANGR